TPSSTRRCSGWATRTTPRRSRSTSGWTFPFLRRASRSSTAGSRGHSRSRGGREPGAPGRQAREGGDVHPALAGHPRQPVDAAQRAGDGPRHRRRLDLHRLDDRALRGFRAHVVQSDAEPGRGDVRRCCPQHPVAADHLLRLLRPAVAVDQLLEPHRFADPGDGDLLRGLPHRDLPRRHPGGKPGPPGGRQVDRANALAGGALRYPAADVPHRAASLSNTLISLFKDTSLGSAISVPELTYAGSVLNTNTWRIVETWTAVGALYLGTCYG